MTEKKPEKKSEKKPEKALAPDAVELASKKVFADNGIKLYGSYEELIKKIKERLGQEAQALTWVRWTLGAHVKALLEGAGYGDHKIDEMVDDIGLSRQTLYACKALFETYSRKEMETRIIPLNIPFRALNYLVRVPDEAERRKLLGQVAKGELKAEDIPAAVAPAEGKAPAADDLKPAKGKEGTPAEKAAAVVRRAIGAVDAPLDLVLPAIRKLDEALRDWSDETDEALPKELAEELVALNGRCGDLRGSIETLGKRAIQVLPAAGEDDEGK